MTKRKNQYNTEKFYLKNILFFKIPAYKSIIGCFYAL